LILSSILLGRANYQLLNLEADDGYSTAAIIPQRLRTVVKDQLTTIAVRFVALFFPASNSGKSCLLPERWRPPLCIHHTISLLPLSGSGSLRRPHRNTCL